MQGVWRDEVQMCAGYVLQVPELSLLLLSLSGPTQVGQIKPSAGSPTQRRRPVPASEMALLWLLLLLVVVVVLFIFMIVNYVVTITVPVF